MNIINTTYKCHKYKLDDNKHTALMYTHLAVSLSLSLTHTHTLSLSFPFSPHTHCRVKSFADTKQPAIIS